MQNTANYNFNLPDDSDFAKIQFINENFGDIDSLIKALETAKANQSTVTNINNNLTSLATTVSTHLEQMTWYDATLINGFTGYIKYAKDAHGIVHIRFRIINVPTIVDLSVLTVIPVGYRPQIRIPLIVSQTNLTPFNNSIPFVIFPYDGGFYLTVNNGLTSTSTDAGLEGEVSYYAGS